MKKFEVVLENGERLVVDGHEATVGTSGTLYINSRKPLSVVAAFPYSRWIRFVTIEGQSE